jgi:hypothetical protein
MLPGTGAQAVAAPFLVGFPLAAFYAFVVRRRLVAVLAPADG